MWEKSISTKSQEDLSRSEQVKRDELIENYRKNLDILEKKIIAAKNELADIQKDIQGTHAGRIAEYDRAEASIKKQQDQLSETMNNAKEALKELDLRRKSLNESVEQETKRVHDNNVAILAKQDQLRALSLELEQQKVVQTGKADELASIEASHMKRASELDAITIDTNKVIEDTLLKHHQVKDQAEALEKDVIAHNQQVEALKLDKQKMLDFYNALQEKEKLLEPLKSKYEFGIKVNEETAKKLKDEGLENYGVLAEINKRIEIANTAEQRAKAEIEKLEALKLDIHKTMSKGE